MSTKETLPHKKLQMLYSSLLRNMDSRIKCKVENYTRVNWEVVNCIFIKNYVFPKS